MNLVNPINAICLQECWLGVDDTVVTVFKCAINTVTTVM